MKKMIGLNEEEVLKSRKENGSNELSRVKRNSFLKLLLESLGDPIIKILLIALAIKVAFLFRDFDWFETIGILVAIFFASFISTISEYGSEAAFARLQEESSKIKCRVRRNGVVKEVEIEEIVEKDVVILSAGDKVPADGYLVEGSLTVDESSLNGETKEAKKTSVFSITSPPKSENELFRGSVIYSKEGSMLVTAVGDKTLYGKLAQEVQEAKPISPLKQRLAGLAKVISRIGYLGAALVTISYLFSVIVINNNFEMAAIIETLTDLNLMFTYLLYALTLSVTIIVVAVPEGLPMMITLVLSSNMKRMLKNNVLVRRLVGIETAGSINVLLTDKTGTLTKGKLEVTAFVSGSLETYKSEEDIKKYPQFHRYFYNGIYYNNASVYSSTGGIIGGNSTDRALLSFINPSNKDNAKVISHVPFDSSVKYSNTLVDNNKKIMHIKGAAEKILPECTKYLDKSGIERILFSKSSIKSEIDRYTKNGIRVIILAYKKDDYENNLLSNLILVGFVCIKDDLRDEAKEGIDLVTSAGIQTIMITGDAKDTAVSIAKEVGLVKSDDDLVITSDELSSLTDDDLKKISKKLKVVSRALPQDKSRLVRILEEENQIVGMTGDGVNDAPALKRAAVGFAMGSGTEVAKEASDIVILDDNILSISKAILYGRTIFKSIRKFIIFQLTVNMCALVMSIVGPFIGIDTPITIIQMLWLNMIMDTLAGLAFSFEPPLKEYMCEPPKKKEDPIINKYMVSEILFTGLYSAIVCILFLKLPIFRQFVRTGEDYKYLYTAFFALFIFIDIFNAFNARTERINIFANLKDNKVFIIIISLIIIVQLYLIYYGGSIFRSYGLNASELILVVVMASTVIPVDWCRKLILKKMGVQRGV